MVGNASRPEKRKGDSMKATSRNQVAVLGALLLVLSGCASVPITGRRQLNLVPDSLIRDMSYQQYGQFISQNKLSTDAEQTAMVKRVGARIAKAVEQYCYENGLADRVAGYQWEFNLVEDPNINAWALPGGKVVVYTGLLPIAQDEAGLAVVMGHEIAHVIARHGAERMSQGLLVEFGGMALSRAIESKPAATQQLFMRSYGLGAQVGFLLRYSRVQESEADHLGLIFMAMAGYDPRAALGFWQRMATAKQGPAPPEFLSTHPADWRRINDIEKLLPEAMQYYKPQEDSAAQ